MAALNPANPAPTIVILSGNTSFALLSIMILSGVKTNVVRTNASPPSCEVQTIVVAVKGIPPEIPVYDLGLWRSCRGHSHTNTCSIDH
jgi:hypothetical protein